MCPPPLLPACLWHSLLALLLASSLLGGAAGGGGGGGGEAGGAMGGGGGGAARQTFLVRPRSVVVTEGDDLMLRCVVQIPQDNIQWTKDGFALGFERDVPGYPRYRYLGDAGRGQHHLAITGATLTEEGEYQCQVGPGSHSPPTWAAANVTVMVPPASITMEGSSESAKMEVSEGATLTFLCQVTDARPPPGVLWYLGDSLVNQAQVTSQVVRSSRVGRWNVRSRVKLVAVTAEDDGKQVTCEAQHPTYRAATTPLRAAITLSVIHPPGTPSITGYRPGEVLVAGDRRTLICRVPGGNPRPALAWYRNGHLLDDTSAYDETSGDTVNTYEVLVTSGEDESVFECRASNTILPGVASVNVTLLVYYPPSSVSLAGPALVEEGDPISLKCQTLASNPPATLTWLVQGDVVGGEERTRKAEAGGWVTSSELRGYKVRPSEVKEVLVECHAVNPALDEVVVKRRIITITRAAGGPVWEGDPQREVEAGATLPLTCLSVGGRPPPLVRIFVEEEMLTTQLSQDHTLTRAKGHLSVSQRYNGAKVTCEVTSPATRSPLTTSVFLNVLFGPKSVSGWVEPAVARVGEVVRLVCETASSSPPAHITWRSNATLHKPGTATPVYLPGEHKGTKTRSEREVHVVALDHGRQVECGASNGVGPSASTTITLDVLHSAVWVVRPPAVVEVLEHTDAVVSATAAVNPGPLRYVWWRGGSVMAAAGGELRLRNVDRSQAGNYTVTAHSHDTSIAASFMLNVQYGPEDVVVEGRVVVSWGEDRNVTCTARGNPVPRVSWALKHVPCDSGDVLSGGRGSAVLMVVGGGRADTGVYRCCAVNSVNASTPHYTELVVKQAPVVGPGGPPYTWVAEGGRGSLRCGVEAAPPPAFVWTRHDGLTLLNSGKYTIHEPQLLDGLVFWASVVEVGSVKHQDYHVYHCTATNALGSATVNVTLRPPARPRPPTDFIVENATWTTLTVAWSPNYEGGRPEAYTIKYWHRDAHAAQYLEVAGGDTSSATVPGLTAGANYTVTLRATNQLGPSSYVTPYIVASIPAPGDGEMDLTREIISDLDTLPGPEPGADTSLGANTSLVVMPVTGLTGAAVVAVNVCIVVCVVKLRRSAATRAAEASMVMSRETSDAERDSTTTTPTIATTTSTTATTTLTTTTAHPTISAPAITTTAPTTSATTKSPPTHIPSDVASSPAIALDPQVSAVAYSSYLKTPAVDVMKTGPNCPDVVGGCEQTLLSLNDLQPKLPLINTLLSNTQSVLPSTYGGVNTLISTPLTAPPTFPLPTSLTAQSSHHSPIPFSHHTPVPSPHHPTPLYTPYTFPMTLPTALPSSPSLLHTHPDTYTPNILQASHPPSSRPLSPFHVSTSQHYGPQTKDVNTLPSSLHLPFQISLPGPMIVPASLPLFASSPPSTRPTLQPSGIINPVTSTVLPSRAQPSEPHPDRSQLPGPPGPLFYSTNQLPAHHSLPQSIFHDPLAGLLHPTTSCHNTDLPVPVSDLLRKRPHQHATRPVLRRVLSSQYLPTLSPSTRRLQHDQQPHVTDLQHSLSCLDLHQPSLLHHIAMQQPTMHQLFLPQPSLHQPSLSKPFPLKPSLPQTTLPKTTLPQPAFSQPVPPKPTLHQPSLPQPSPHHTSSVQDKHMPHTPTSDGSSQPSATGVQAAPRLTTAAPAPGKGHEAPKQEQSKQKEELPSQLQEILGQVQEVSAHVQEVLEQMQDIPAHVQEVLEQVQEVSVQVQEGPRTQELISANANLHSGASGSGTHRTRSRRHSSSTTHNRDNHGAATPATQRSRGRTKSSSKSSKDKVVEEDKTKL